MKRRGKQAGVGVRGEREGAVRGAFGAFREWVLGQAVSSDAGPAGLRDEAPGCVPASAEKRAVWFRRVWAEGDRGDKERCLRVFAMVQPSEATSFLREVAGAEEAPLRGRLLALDLLRNMGPAAGTGVWEDGLNAARQWVERLAGRPESGDDTGSGREDELLAAFDDLTPALRRAAAEEGLEVAPGPALAFLGGWLGEQASRWDDLLPVLGQSPHPGAADLIRQGYHGARDRALRKRMKRCNHQRRSLGLPVVSLEDEEERRPVWSPPAAVPPEGLLSVGENPDEKIVWILHRQAPAATLVLSGWVVGGVGLGKFTALDLSRAEARLYREAVLRNKDLRAVEVDPAYCAFLLEEAYKKKGPGDPEEAEAYRAVRTMIRELLPPDGAAPAHPIHSVLAAGPGKGAGCGRSGPARDLAGILEWPLLQDWRLAPESWKSHRERLEEILNSRIIVHPLQKRERTESFYREVAADVFSLAEERERWKTRLEDAAWALHQSGDREGARTLADAALQFGKLEDPSRNRFCVALVRRSLDAWARQRQTEARETPSLIVRPS